jgi:hypothetical protein
MDRLVRTVSTDTDYQFHQGTYSVRETDSVSVNRHEQMGYAPVFGPMMMMKIVIILFT